MILADTSVWVDHLRVGVPELARLLNAGEVLGHPHVVGELACGNLRRRADILRLLRELPSAELATEDEVLECVERNRLQGAGLGWTDVHLLASALLTPCSLWTRDAALKRATARCGIAIL
ncbi:MAG: type II toxin-antitoxin system VapC family toxin [Myxococcales bacterium]